MHRHRRSSRRLRLEAAAALCLAGAAFAAPVAAPFAHAEESAVELATARQSELRALVRQDCGSCHGMTLKGGLGSPLRPSDLDHFEPAAIAQIVLEGVPGTPMPPWRGLLSDAEAMWIAKALKTGDFK